MRRQPAVLRPDGLIVAAILACLIGCSQSDGSIANERAREELRRVAGACTEAILEPDLPGPYFDQADALPAVGMWLPGSEETFFVGDLEAAIPDIGARLVSRTPTTIWIIEDGSGAAVPSRFDRYRTPEAGDLWVLTGRESGLPAGSCAEASPA